MKSINYRTLFWHPFLRFISLFIIIVIIKLLLLKNRGKCFKSYLDLVAIKNYFFPYRNIIIQFYILLCTFNPNPFCFFIWLSKNFSYLLLLYYPSKLFISC